MAVARKFGIRGAAAVSLLVASAFPAAASARVLRVPRQLATIQDAVDAARPGDEIQVGPGQHCGATIDKKLTLVGEGRPVIVGCDDGPIVFGSLHAGFFLPGADGDSAASGTRITGFVFDGRGVSNTNLAPIAMAVFGRFADDVEVTNNLFLGTVQAITNTAGDRWVIAGNTIRDLTLFDCTGAFCSGGAGIVIQVASASVAAPGGDGDPVNRPEGNVVARNDIEGTIPDGFDVFSMVGVFVFAADRTVVARNRIAIPDNPNADATGEGILVDDNCCDSPTPVTPGARGTVVLFNDGLRSQFAVVVAGTGGANMQGLALFGNLGVEVVEGVTITGPGPRPNHLARRERFY
jgi:nitrous oxidase accessory protein NosD